MKKLCFVAAAILAASVAFAQGNVAQQGKPIAGEQEVVKPERGIEKFDVEINVGFPIHWTNGLHDDPANAGNMIEDKFVTANTAIGFGMNYNFNRTVGLALDMDFSFGAKLSGFATPTSDYIGLSGANIFLGPVMYLHNSNGLRIPLAFGFHMYYFGDDLWIPDLGTAGAWINRQELQFGLGISLGVQYHFDNGIYMFSRTNVAFDFIRVHSMKDSDGTALTKKSHTDLSANWSVKPCLGIGIKF